MIILALLCISFSTRSQQQQPYIDSLVRELNKCGNDTNKLKILADLTSCYYTNPGEDMKYATQAMSLAQTLKYQKWVGEAYNCLALAYLNKKDYDESLKNYLISLKISREVGDRRGEGYCLGGIGVIYYNQKKYKMALKYLFQSKELWAQIGDRKYLTNTIYNIGMTYNDKGNSGKALNEYFLPVLETCIAYNDKYGLAHVYLNCANIYVKFKKYDCALDFATKGVALATEIGYTEGVEYGNKLLAVIKKKTRK